MTEAPLDTLTPFGVLPDDYADMPFAAAALRAGRGGSLRFKHGNGHVYSFPALADGEVVPLDIVRVYATGTTAGRLTGYARPVRGVPGPDPRKDAPGPPRGLYAAARTDTGLTFFWSPPTGLTAADVNYLLGLAPAGSPPAATVPTAADRYDFAGLTPEASYTFRLRAVTAAGRTGRAVDLTVSTQAAVAAVTSLTVSGVTAGAATASWAPPAGEDPAAVYYEVGVGLASGGAPAFTLATEPGDALVALTGLAGAADYAVRVRAVRPAAAGTVRGPAASAAFTTAVADGTAPDYWAADYWDAAYWG